ncbi:hypothetical protein TTHT_0261 [Thermotomaculum hydrothermale]|uniref:Outer membrane lipoprotein BamD-like domain-containing protein n=1 Tax=Thermotomaculum hydrothermale TaxID=981385 RepID=A0A7R6SXT5_9BACT|nr:tetratricopeptide repeat protein [Thermotomaculum hydrothermale]BBB31885.1 hypothetical protein TTHT_0261 [Thermotomaculum hydrothermale]
MKLLMALLLIANFTTSTDLRIYESGMAFLLNKNYSEAIKEFQTLVEQYPQSEKADEALLEIGKYYYLIGEKDKALKYFDRVINDYKSSNSYDNALYYKGMIMLDNQDIDSAYGILSKIKAGIPDSEILDKVYYKLGEICGLKGNYKQGLYFLSKVYMRFPESEVFDESMELASYFYYKLNNPGEGLKMLSFITLENIKDNNVPFLTTNLLRFYLNKKYKIHRTYYQISKPGVIITDKRGTLYAYSKKEDAFYLITKGKMRKFSTPSEVTSIFYSKRFGFYYSTSNRVFNKTEGISKSFTDGGEPLSNIVSIAIDYFGNYLIYDKDKAVVYKFDKTGKLLKKIVAPADYIKIRKDGKIFIVRDSRNVIDVRDFEGKLIKTFANYSKIVDLDFDNYDNIYMLVDKGKTLVILKEDFSLFQKIDIYNLLGGKFYHMTVDGDGTIFLADKSSSIVRFN